MECTMYVDDQMLLYVGVTPGIADGRRRRSVLTRYLQSREVVGVSLRVRQNGSEFETRSFTHNLYAIDLMVYY